MTDPFNLERFVRAQAPVFDTVLNELRAGRKQTHWMWFAFPQLRGLGRSSIAEYYGISSLAEARAFWRTPCWATARSVQEDGTRHRSAVAYCDLPIFGSPDDMKFRSCATLFALVSAERDNPFQRALDRWCDGPPDERTLALTRHDH